MCQRSQLLLEVVHKALGFIEEEMLVASDLLKSGLFHSETTSFFVQYHDRHERISRVRLGIQ